MIRPIKIIIQDFSLDSPFLAHSQLPTKIIVKNFVLDSDINYAQDTTVITIKAYPSNEFSFCNYKDTIIPPIIYIEDYPEYMSEYAITKVGTFNAHLYAKLKIGVSPEHPGRLPIINSHLHLMPHVNQKGNGLAKFLYNPVASPVIKQRLTGTIKLKHRSECSPKIRYKVTGTSRTKFGASLVQGKYYLVQRFTLGYWDDHTLGSMDTLDNIDLEGAIIL